ncbi:GyrI-like domain-containing protein [Microbacterium luticocti]|uniref:GyrI-like domain-containing protein n=1 Tax=Microbacterium luticocti TaxID=451764 RepID=UPI000403824C|nr:GyrI-like domain-containing protein [Microbacterium luticocti]
MTDKIDFTKTLDAYQARRGAFRLVEVPEMRYLMVDGHGDPNGDPAYREALETVYPLAYRLKFASKRELGRDYVVPPLEGLWWADDMEAFTGSRDKSRWDWTMMIMVPEWIDRDLLAQTIERLRAKAPPPRLDDLRLEAVAEGLSVQTLHVGPFDDEGPVLERMHHDFIPANGLRPNGKHHEIYLSDVRKTAPEKLRTVLRQPVSRTTPSPLTLR